MRKQLVIAWVAAIVAGSATLCLGAGFKVNEQGSKAMGMANAFTALADDPSALYYNPAGIAFLKGTQVSLGSLVIAVPQTEFTGTTPLTGNPPFDIGTSPVYEKAKRDLFIAPTLYATYSLEEMPLSFGLGINAIYPLAKSWDNGGAFRNQVENISIKPINFQPTVAYRLDDLNLAVAAGLDVTYAMVSLQKAAYVNSISNGAPFGAFELGELGVDATAIGVGYNLGVLWKPRNDLSFGIAYRSEVTLHLNGDANFVATTPAGLSAMGVDISTIPANALPFIRQTSRSSASTTITLPDSLSLGVAWKPTDKLTLDFDAVRTGWSSLDNINISFNNSTPLKAFNNNPIATNWHDAWTYMLGGQYAYNKYLDLRSGFAYDTNPIPDSTLAPLLPDSDRTNLSFGLGIHNEHVALDMAYMWVHWLDRTVTNQDLTTLTGENGTFKSDAHLFGANVTVKF